MTLGKGVVQLDCPTQDTGRAGTKNGPSPVEKHPTSVALIGLGCVFVGVGAAGIGLPLLPTTPFLLLAAACFWKASPRLYRWLTTNRVFGWYIRAYLEKRGVLLAFKVSTIAVLWITISFSALVGVDIPWVRWVLLGIACGVTVHLLKLPTFRIAAGENRLPKSRLSRTNQSPLEKFRASEKFDQPFL